ncbi:hypothetical protein HN587_04015 [Candidatus Woesearchaeota archaeon]|jgi:hypothetical protein|nr:hypothetical protein [Candidatus Woesearchaeota archaeon]
MTRSSRATSSDRLVVKKGGIRSLFDDKKGISNNALALMIVVLIFSSILFNVYVQVSYSSSQVIVVGHAAEDNPQDFGRVSLCLNDQPVVSVNSCEPYAFVGNPYFCGVQSSDSDGHDVSFVDDSSFFEIDELTGIITFTPNSSMIGNHSFLIIGNDDLGCANSLHQVELNISIIEEVVTPNSPVLNSFKQNCTDDFIVLNWTNVTPDYYEIYYSDSLTELREINTYEQIANVSNLDGDLINNWTDNIASKQFYKVVAVNEWELSEFGVLKASSNIVGQISLTAYQDSILTISNPFNSSGQLVGDYICPAQENHNLSVTADKIRMFYGDNLQKYAYWFGPDTGWYSPSNPKLLELENNVGYYIHPISQTYNITFTGQVIDNLNREVSFSFVSGSVSTIGMSYPYMFNLSLIAPLQKYCGAVSCSDKVRVFYGETNQKYAYWFGDLFGWFSASNPVLDYLEPGYGYYFNPINQSYTSIITVNSGVENE